MSEQERRTRERKLDTTQAMARTVGVSTASAALLVLGLAATACNARISIFEVSDDDP